MKKTSRKYNINNLEELHAMVNSLKAQHQVKGDLLLKDSKSYLMQFTLGGLIKKYATPSAFLKIDDKLNISSSVMSMVLPFLMNTTLFKGSGFLTKHWLVWPQIRLVKHSMQNICQQYSIQ